MNIAPFRKCAVAVATALTTLAVVMTDGVTNQEWIAVALAAFSALGVYAVKNEA